MKTAIRYSIIVLTALATLALYACTPAQDLSAVKQAESFIDIGVATSQAVVAAVVTDANERAQVSAIINRVSDANQAAERITAGLSVLDTSSKAKILASIQPVLDEITTDVQNGALPISNPNVKQRVELVLAGVRAALAVLVNHVT